ncbi:unnamed protein product [Merluccius merluccius]
MRPRGANIGPWTDLDGPWMDLDGSGWTWMDPGPPNVTRSIFPPIRHLKMRRSLQAEEPEKRMGWNGDLLLSHYDEGASGGDGATGPSLGTLSWF